LLRWPSVAAFIRDATVIATYRLYDYLRARVVWQRGGPPFVDATAGNFTAAIPDADPALELLAPAGASAWELHDLLGELRPDALAGWSHASAVLELVLPLPGALAWWPELESMIAAARIPEHFRRGAGAMVLPCRPRLPMAPLPDSSHCMVLALRPRGTGSEARALIGALRDIARFALDRGARIYRIGVEDLGAAELERQYGAALPGIVALKRRLDPDNLCNPGILDPVL
jgi:hypothetical protein